LEGKGQSVWTSFFRGGRGAGQKKKLSREGTERMNLWVIKNEGYPWQEEEKGSIRGSRREEGLEAIQRLLSL